MADPIEIVKKSLIRRPSSESNMLDYGKLPPQAKDLEEAVLAALMIEESAAHKIQAFLIPDMFYVDAHQRIARAIHMLYKNNGKIDLLTVTEQLKKNGELDASGGPFYIAQLTNKIGSAANVESHVRIVFEKYIQRRLISQSTEIIKDAYEDTTDPILLFEKAESGFRETNQLFQTGSMPTTSTVLDKADEQMATGHIASKHDSLNRAFGGGWQMGTVNVVAARPGMGKTALLISEGVNCVSNNVPTAMFMLEMMERQTVMRLICNLSKIPNTRYKEKKHWHAGDDERVAAARKWIIDHDHNLSMDFKPGQTVYEIIAKMRKIKREKGLKVAFIDYLQLIASAPDDIKGKTKDQQIGIIMQALKNFAKEEDVAIILFCQLSRAVEETKDKVPNLTHLRESGNIEQDADTVLFLLRPEYYFGRDADGHITYANDEQAEFRNVCNFINAKNRDGHLFESKEMCDLSISNFRNGEVGGDTPF